MEIVDNDLDVCSRSKILVRGNNKPWISSNE